MIYNKEKHMRNEQNLLCQNVGIDVSKDSLDIVFSTINVDHYVKVKGSRRFSNSNSGFEQVHQWIENKRNEAIEVRISMEATGIYHESLALFLHMKNYSISVILPTKAKRYFQAIGHKSKTDGIDAKGLSRMGLEQRLPVWEPLTRNIYSLRLLTRQLEDFNNQRTVFLNQLHALGHSAYEVKDVEKSLKKMVKALDQGIAQLEQAIKKLIETDEVLKTKVEKLLTIKGVGLKTIAVLLSETNGFTSFESQGQLVSYAGYDIVKNQSGERMGKTRMSKKGNAHIRRAMHMPAFSVVRHQVAPFYSLHKRLMAKGKKKMQAYVAVQRKLLILIWTLWKKNECYDPSFELKTDGTSGNDEPKHLFSLGTEGAIKDVVPNLVGTTLDELPCKESPEALFSLL